MEIALSFLERLGVIAIGIFALYQCFQIDDTGRLSRPLASWTVRFALLALAGICFFAFVRIVATTQ